MKVHHPLMRITTTNGHISAPMYSYTLFVELCEPLLEDQ